MVDYKDVELARTGSFDASTGPVTLTQADFDHMSAAYKLLKGKVDVPIKLGHEDGSDSGSGQPAAGWVENVRRVGDKLMADLMNVPSTVAKMIDSGALRKRSIEAIRNTTLAGEKCAMALTGLALLGAELPAVDSLEDMSKLYASGRVVDTTKGGFIKVQLAADINPSKEKLALDDELLSTLRRMLDLPDSATQSDIQEALGKLKPSQLWPQNNSAPPSDNMSEKTEASGSKESEEMSKMKASLSEAHQEIIKLKNESAREAVTLKVDEAIKARKFMPAAREGLIKLAVGDSVAFDELVKSTPDNAVLAPEKGTSSSDGIPDEVRPTDMESKIAAQIGLKSDDILQYKAREAGVSLPSKKE